MAVCDFSAIHQYQRRFTGIGGGGAANLAIDIQEAASISGARFYCLCVADIWMVSVAVNVVLQPSVLSPECCSEPAPGRQTSRFFCFRIQIC